MRSGKEKIGEEEREEGYYQLATHMADPNSGLFFIVFLGKNSIFIPEKNRVFTVCMTHPLVFKIWYPFDNSNIIVSKLLGFSS